MKEIGGYFGAEQNHGDREYYPDLTALNTARNALVYVCRAKGIRKLYIPYYLCDSVSNVLDREKIAYEFYHVDRAFRPVFEKRPAENEYLYVVNYYGQLGNEELAEYRDRFHRVIVDNIHAFFQTPVEGMDTIYSCRKFFGVPDGAYLSTNAFLTDLPKDRSDDRMSHIIGRIADGASAHYAEFKANDASFKQLPLMTMSDLTRSLLADIDYTFVKRRREENWKTLHEGLKALNGIDVSFGEGPYAYPFYCGEAVSLRKKLAERKIFVATLWPNVVDGEEAELTRNVMPLPCDQRYDEEDMRFVIESVRELAGC